MKQTTKNILGVAAIVLLSSGVAGLTTYKMLNKEKPATFSELFEQNPNNLQLAAYNATDAQPVDLTQAAENSVHAVVHIRAKQLSKTQTVQGMPDIFDLYDTIEMEFATAFNETGGKYGRKKYSGYKQGKVIGLSKFGLHELYYKIPDGLIYPALAAFRSLVVLNLETNKYEWKNGVSPITVWDKCKNGMTSQIMNFASAIGDNPNAVGKDSNIWNLAYMTVLLYQGMN